MSDHVAVGVEQWRSLRPDWDLTGMAVFGRVYRLARLLDLERNALLEPYGLQVGDIDILATLFRHREGLRPRELRRAMMIGSGTLTPRLDRLEAAGLLERHRDPTDRRGRVLRLTAKGERLIPDLIGRLLDLENEVLSALPATVRARLARDLGRLLGSVDPAD